MFCVAAQHRVFVLDSVGKRMYAMQPDNGAIRCATRVFLLRSSHIGIIIWSVAVPAPIVQYSPPVAAPSSSPHISVCWGSDDGYVYCI